MCANGKDHQQTWHSPFYADADDEMSYTSTVYMVSLGLHWQADRSVQPAAATIVSNLDPFVAMPTECP